MITFRTKCPRCENKKLWKLKSGKIRCAKCRHTFTLRIAGIKIDSRLLRKVTKEFILEHSTNTILALLPISQRKMLKTLYVFRKVMSKDTPESFSGTVEVDETYIGGQWKNKPLKIKLKSTRSKRGLGTTKQPIFGILCRDGKVFAELISKTEAKNLQPIIQQKVKQGSTVCSDTWRGYTGIAAKGYVHRIVNHGKHEYSNKKGNHINGLEGFWGYLKRKLSAKGGIRRKKLHLYLGEYVWRYNHRNLTIQEQINHLIYLVFKEN